MFKLVRQLSFVKIIYSKDKTFKEFTNWPKRFGTSTQPTSNERKSLVIAGHLAYHLGFNNLLIPDTKVRIFSLVFIRN